MIRIQQLKLPIEAGQVKIEEKIRRILKVSDEMPIRWNIFRRSLDARRGREFSFIYIIDVESPKEERIWKKIAGQSGVERMETPRGYEIPQGLKSAQRPVVVGFGPAGMFCGLVLAKAGLRPIIIERGRKVEERARDVETFCEQGILNPESNVQFGEGGAGTFSDGKLNTLVKDKNRRGRFVLEEMVKAGAPEEILYVNKPHVGTDRLKETVKNIRLKIERLGGTFYFECRLTGLEVGADWGITGITVCNQGQEEKWPCDTVFLGIGHSARDTFAMLRDTQIPMEQKAFAVGVRVEHLQSRIDEAQYRQYAGSPYLGAADYKLTHQAANGRGVYTFCMCPGGHVIAAASEEGGVVTNGMSNFAREGENSNSAVLVTVTPADYKVWENEHGVLAGVEFQRSLERAAYQLGGSDWSAPVQRLEDFVANRPSTGWGQVKPSYTGKIKPSNLRDILPDYVGDSIAEGLVAFEKHLEGFADPDALLTGVESRSSSPVRILRDEESLMSRCHGLYPMGEGAGYAGGIMSAAMDGMRVAEAWMGKIGGGPPSFSL